MNKLLSLALWLWLPIALDAFLKCVNCGFELPGRGCVKHKKPCRLYSGESCFKKTAFYGNTPLYTEKGCTQNCLSINQPKEPWNISEIIDCCANKAFCNR